MTVTDAERTKAEIERGRERAAHNERRARVDRYRLMPNVRCQYFPYGNVECWDVDGVEVARVDPDDPNYPTDQLLATLALALAATVGLNNVPPLPPTHRVSREGKEYNQRLRERNAGREDFK